MTTPLIIKFKMPKIHTLNTIQNMTGKLKKSSHKTSIIKKINAAVMKDTENINDFIPMTRMLFSSIRL